MRVPIRRSEQERLARQRADRLLTPEALARMQRTLERLKIEQRAAADEAHRCAEMGDRSDNAAYTAAKAQLNRLLGRITSLEDRLRHAIIIERGAGVDGTIRVGSTVVVSVDGSERTFDILGSQESNPGRGCISHQSPLGHVLIGHHAGDDVHVVVNGKEKWYRVVSVR